MQGLILRCCGLFLWLTTVLGAASAAADDEIYELPPFVTYGYSFGANWCYAEIPGFEILSQCSDRETREIVAALWRGRRLVLPESMRPHFSLPMTVVLYNQSGPGGGGLASFGNRRGAGEMQPHWVNLIKRTLEDRESFALNLWPGSFNYSASFRFDLFTLLRRRSPSAPEWLSEGMFGGYGVYREGIYWQETRAKKVVHVAVWHSAEGIQQIAVVNKQLEDLRKKKKPMPKVTEMISGLEDFVRLLESPPPARDNPARERWEATAALFVRWGTYDCPPEQVAQFWRFAERACSEVVTESLFKECFSGRSYDDVRAELSWYILTALQAEGEADARDLEPMPKLVLKQATGAQIARVRGEWERMEAAALSVRFPDAAAKYREQAARTLGTSPKTSDLDPRVQASRGLLALETGDLAAARECLEKAVAGKVAGPRPYLELARLRWAAERLDDAGTLPPEKLAGISELILAAEMQQPALASVYLLLAEAVKQTGVATPGQTAALLRGKKLFPRSPDVQAAVVRSLDSK